MKKLTIFASAISMSAALASGAAAQGTALLPGETALQFAQRVDACGGAGINSAAFNEDRTEVRVRCAQVAGGTDGMTGGLGTTGGVIVAVLGAAAVAAAASGGGGSSTSSTPSTN